MKMHGITKRWLINCFGLIFLSLAGIGFSCYFIVHHFFFHSIPMATIEWNVEMAQKTVGFLILVLITAGILVFFIVGISNFYFIQSIVDPVKQIAEISKQIALGDFDIKIEKSLDDEIGDLCDAINYMAGELRDSEKMKNDFISSISHELRTPLTAIKGWAETIRMSDDPASDVNKKGIHIIIDESERLCGIVEELLDFSSIQNGRISMMMDKMDLLAELSEAVYIFKNKAADQNKEINYTEPSMLSPIMGDKNRIRQVFINILDNSIKYTPEGGTITINTEKTDDRVVVEVRDNGEGISSVHLPKVKQKFYKANQTQVGAGIGLAISDEIISMHGGTLEILSEEGVGTTVIISLPLLVE